MVTVTVGVARVTPRVSQSTTLPVSANTALVSTPYPRVVLWVPLPRTIPPVSYASPVNDGWHS